MKARHWSLAIVLILINYLIFATLFTRLVETDFARGRATRMPEPTFTPAPAEPITIVPTPIPVTPVPTPTATKVLPTPETNADIQANSSEPASQQAAHGAQEPAKMNLVEGCHDAHS